MWIQGPLYNLPYITNAYNRNLTKCTILVEGYYMKVNRNMAAFPFARPTSSRRQSEETKLKISKANKGKRLGCIPWNRGKKLHYIPGKREHSEETKKKMSEAAKRRWA